MNSDYRYEKKFVINNPSHYYIINFIKQNKYCFQKSYEDRVVNNIYFDTDNMDYYRDNIEGNNRRKKVRIRWYGKQNGEIKKPILQFKIKQNNLGKKIEYKLNDFLLNNNYNQNNQFLQFKKANLPEKIIENLSYLNIILMNSYNRQYYESKILNVRLTLDTSIKYYKLNKIQNNFVYNIKDYNSNIIELKYTSELSNKINCLTNTFPFRVVKNSKYINGYNLLFNHKE